MNKPAELRICDDGTGQCPLPNGCTLYWRPDEVGGRYYFSDDCPIGVPIWDTSLVDQSTLLATMTMENTLLKIESMKKP
jgi:hypothetical protein